MSKGPDLSAFPIPRKGSARPIGLDAPPPAPAVAAAPVPALSVPAPPISVQPSPLAMPAPPAMPTLAAPPAAPVSQGRLVAATVKLDEGRYLRLAEAGKPEPGRLRRRTIQDIMVEALDEWFQRRGL